MKKTNQPLCGFSKRDAYPFTPLFTGRKIFSHTLILMALIAVLTLPTSCKKDKDTPSTLNTQDRAFFDSAAVSNLFEIELSNLALTKAQNASVKQYGQQMVNDHTLQTANLRQLASSKGVTLPTALPPAKQNLRSQLAGLSGTQFDSVYMNIQVISHQQTVINFQAEINNGQDADVKNFASTNLPAIQHHLEMAEDLTESLDF
jgi:putative membrane protein